MLPDRYDDGGISGGHLDRPYLHRLMRAVDEKRVHQIVVYKIDRLTRSLADVRKLVERLDQAEASFLAVIQSFNTATSIGRLSLNVLMSFAPFEREVTTERIRHKGQIYEGQHPAIIGPAVWDQVQEMLRDGAAKARGTKRRATQSLLAGKLFDETGDRLTPSHSQKHGKRLR